MQKYEEQFNDIVNYALLNKINEIIFQERNSGSKILMGKLGNFSIYNDFYEKDHLRQIFKSIYEKYTKENFDETNLHCQKNNIDFNGLNLEYFFVETYPNGFDVNFKLI